MCWALRQSDCCRRANARNVSFFYPLRWLIYVFNSVVNTKLPAILSHRCSTTVSLETYPFTSVQDDLKSWFIIILNSLLRTNKWTDPSFYSWLPIHLNFVKFEICHRVNLLHSFNIFIPFRFVIPIHAFSSLLALVVWRVDNAIRWINLYPVYSAVPLVNTYLLDSDLSVG